MKTLLLNSLKIRRKAIYIYFIVNFIIIALSIMKEFFDIFHNINSEGFSFALIIICLILYVTFIITSESIVEEKSYPYLLTLKASRKDFVNAKFIIYLISLLISSLIIFYLIGNINTEEMGNIEIFIFIESFIFFYLLIVPISIKFGRGSGVGSLLVCLPALLPLLDNLGINVWKFIVPFLRRENKNMSILILLIFFLIIYFSSIHFAEKKDF